MTTNRRKDFRIPFYQEIKIKTLLLDNQYVELPKPIVATAINLSCSGILLTTDLNLPPEVCFCTDIPFCDETVSTICSVVRKEEMAEGKWNYGCKFLQTEETLRSKIRRYVFEQQTKFRLNETKSNPTYA